MFFKFYYQDETICIYVDIDQIVLNEANSEIRIYGKSSIHGISITSFSKGRETAAFNSICKAISESKHYFDITEYQGE